MISRIQSHGSFLVSTHQLGSCSDSCLSVDQFDVISDSHNHSTSGGQHSHRTSCSKSTKAMKQ